MDNHKIREYLKRIRSSLYKFDYKSLIVDCNSILTKIPISIIDFTNEAFFFRQQEGAGLNLIYRARINENNQPWGNVSDISYIKEEEKHKLKTFGRVNKPNEPMFYGSLDYPTACSEATTKGNIFKDKNSVILTVGVWKFETPLTLAEIPHSEKYFRQLYETLNFKSNSIQIEHIQEANLEMKKKLNSEIGYEILEFFADEFAKFDMENNNEYMLSNYYADRIFNRIKEFTIEEIDGIMYPSIALSYQHKNIVLKPEVIDKKLKFLHAMEIWVTDGGADLFLLDKEQMQMKMENYCGR